MEAEELWILSKLWQFLNIVYLPMSLTYFNHVFIALLDFLVLAHYISIFGSFWWSLALLVNCFLEEYSSHYIKFFFWFLIHLTSLFSSKSFITTFWYDFSELFKTAFWIAVVLLDESKLNLSFPNFSRVYFWFSKERKNVEPWLTHLYVFRWLKTFPFPNLRKELLKVVVICACLDQKWMEKLFIRDLLKTR